MDSYMNIFRYLLFAFWFYISCISESNTELQNYCKICVCFYFWTTTNRCLSVTRDWFCWNDNFASLLLRELIKELQTGLFNLWKVKQEMFAETNFSSSRALTKQTFFTRASFDAGAQWGWLWVKKSLKNQIRFGLI